MIKFITIAFLFFICYTNSYAETEDFVINKNKAVSDLELKEIKDAWNIIRIDYPKATPVFMYSCNGVDFSLFDLKKDNRYVIFNSPSFPQIKKFTIDGVDQAKSIQKCFMKLPPRGVNNADSLRLFGGVFKLDEESVCKLEIESDIGFGKYSFNISRKIDIERKNINPDETVEWSWWEGSVSITLTPINRKGMDK